MSPPRDARAAGREREPAHAARSANRTTLTGGAVAPGLGHRNAAGAWLPWIHRAAETLIYFGPDAVALRQRPRDEQIAVLRCAVELLGSGDDACGRSNGLTKAKPNDVLVVEGQAP
jgi:hypothetical protein